MNAPEDAECSVSSTTVSPPSLQTTPALAAEEATASARTYGSAPSPAATVEERNTFDPKRATQIAAGSAAAAAAVTSAAAPALSVSSSYIQMTLGGQGSWKGAGASAAMTTTTTATTMMLQSDDDTGTSESASLTGKVSDSERMSSSEESSEDDDASGRTRPPTPPVAMEEDDLQPTSTVNDCVICGPGEKATGYHFGAMTCEACKAFFRRAVRKDHTYSCRMDRACEVSRETRGRCKYCRLQKCFRVGMKKDHVQGHRGPIAAGALQRSASDQLAADYLSATAVVPMPAVSGMLEVDFFQDLPNDDASIIVKHMIDAEKRAMERLSLPDYASPVASSLNEVVQAFRELFLEVINWAKKLPEFDNLDSKENQAAALRVSWMDLATFSLSTRAQAGNFMEGVFLNAHRMLSRENCFDDELGRLVGRLIDELVLPFRTLNISDFEMACIRGLLFFCPEKHRSEYELSRKMTYYQDSLIGELMDRCTVNIHHRKSNRYGKLLLRVSALQAISAELFRYFMMHDRTFFNARGNGSGSSGSYGVNTVLNTMLLLPLEC